MHHHLPIHLSTIKLKYSKASGSSKIVALSQIKPQTPRLVVSFRQYLQVSALRPYSPHGA